MQNHQETTITSSSESTVVPMSHIGLLDQMANFMKAPFEKSALHKKVMELVIGKQPRKFVVPDKANARLLKLIEDYIDFSAYQQLPATQQEEFVETLVLLLRTAIGFMENKEPIYDDNYPGIVFVYPDRLIFPLDFFESKRLIPECFILATRRYNIHRIAEIVVSDDLAEIQILKNEFITRLLLDFNIMTTNYLIEDLAALRKVTVFSVSQYLFYLSIPYFDKVKRKEFLHTLRADVFFTSFFEKLDEMISYEKIYQEKSQSFINSLTINIQKKQMILNVSSDDMAGYCKTLLSYINLRELSHHNVAKEMVKTIKNFMAGPIDKELFSTLFQHQAIKRRIHNERCIVLKTKPYPLKTESVAHTATEGVSCASTSTSSPLLGFSATSNGNPQFFKSRGGFLSQRESMTLSSDEEAMGCLQKF